MKGNGGVGKLGEDLACGYLEAKGQTVVKRNWRCGHLEVDIITEHSLGVHFVEVKSRVAPSTAAPEEKVDTVKRRRITRAALKYLHDRENAPGGDVEVFFDIVSVVFKGEGTEIAYYPGAWIPMYV